MKILVLNCGSSSVKYQLINMDTENVIAIGVVERVGIEGSFLKHKAEGKDQIKVEQPIPNHTKAIEVVVEALTNEKTGVIKDKSEIGAIGHRLVHGGEKFASSVYITDEVISKMEECTELAPLHNPHNLKGVEAAKNLFPGVPQGGAFDTAFHQTMPKKAFLYALPFKYYEKYRLRRYGFHGTSHFYVSNRAAEILGKDVKDLKIVTCHLGNGASMAAVKHGKSVDTSMGFTPLEGLVMGTRSGDFDPAIVQYLMKKENKDIDEINRVFQKESGAKGLYIKSSDMRDIEDAAISGDEQGLLTQDVYAYRIKKYIGAYAAAMGGIDVLIFTGGTGENSDYVRRDVCKDMEFLGLKIDHSKNDGLRGKEAIVSADESRAKIMVVPTNEELVIARDTLRVVKENKK